MAKKKFRVRDTGRLERVAKTASPKVVRITRVLEKHHSYEVETIGNSMSSESECYELVPLDKSNQRIIDKVEKLLETLR